jgi:bifunctional DNase/RNase
MRTKTKIFNHFKLVGLGIMLVYFTLSGGSLSAQQEESSFLEVKVRGVAAPESSESPVVVLETMEHDKALFIWVGVPEATAIELELNHITPPRPMTHDLLKNILEKLEARVKKVRITELRGNTYYASIDLVVRGVEVVMDSRPSDAIALALRTNSPIYVAKKIIEERSIDISEETETDTESFSKYGITVQTLTPALAKLLQVPEGEGVLIAQVKSDTVAAKAGLLRGDVITQLGGTSIKTLQEFKQKMESLTEKEVPIKILRDGKPLDLILKIE